jgi:serine/threonine-protein kinase HipA
MQNLTLQTYWDDQWHDTAALILHEPEKGLAGRFSVNYQPAYVLDNIEHLHSVFSRSVSAMAPLSWDSLQYPTSPAFLFDIAPAGAAKRALLRHMNISKQQGRSRDGLLLETCTPAPIGHLRILESVDDPDCREPIGFSLKDITDHSASFIDFAQSKGANIRAALGACGEAPKVLLTETTQGLLYPDSDLDDAQASKHWLVKFARNNGTARDQVILRSEYLYYKALHSLGVDTIRAPEMRLEEGERPSLWLPRFDRDIVSGSVQRHAVESIYSLAQVIVPGSYMEHGQVIELLTGLWRQAGQQDQIPELIAEYLRRDLIKRLLGDTDNHGRNIAIIRGQNSIRLAPLYDVAPMAMDDEGVSRSTKWKRPIEVGGAMDWKLACQSLSHFIDPEFALVELRAAAKQLSALPDLLFQDGLPNSTFNHPGIALGQLTNKLKNWDLL